jgi:hypothetical protein
VKESRQRGARRRRRGKAAWRKTRDARCCLFRLLNQLYTIRAHGAGSDQNPPTFHSEAKESRATKTGWKEKLGAAATGAAMAVFCVECNHPGGVLGCANERCVRCSCLLNERTARANVGFHILARRHFEWKPRSATPASARVDEQHQGWRMQLHRSRMRRREWRKWREQLRRR